MNLREIIRRIFYIDLPQRSILIKLFWAYFLSSKLLPVYFKKCPAGRCLICKCFIWLPKYTLLKSQLFLFVQLIPWWLTRKWIIQPLQTHQLIVKVWNFKALLHRNVFLTNLRFIYSCSIWGTVDKSLSYRRGLKSNYFLVLSIQKGCQSMRIKWNF